MYHLSMQIKYFETYTTLEAMTLVRFGMWDEVLKLPFRKDSSVHLMHTLFLRFARGVACGAKGDVVGARVEQKEFLALLQTLKPGDRLKHNVDGRDMAEIAREVNTALCSHASLLLSPHRPLFCSLLTCLSSALSSQASLLLSPHRPLFCSSHKR